MPLYEYKCQNCGQCFELLRHFTKADDPVSCPKCGESIVNRLPSLVNAYSAGRSLTQGASNCASCVGKNCGSCS